VYLKVLPMRDLRHFKVRGKFVPGFFGLFKITEDREEELKTKFSEFFSDPFESRGRDSF
jgi:hypothetical protein